MGCARDGVPGVYARVSGAIDWIKEQVCKLSAFPPARCFGVDYKQPSFLRIDIQYDSEPGDTSWKLKRKNGATIGVSVPVTENWARGTRVSTFFNISYGDYKFTVEDSYGDGFYSGKCLTGDR